MYKFRIPVTVDIHEVDFNGIAKTSSVLRYMQTAAQTQLTESGMSYDQLYDRNRAFLLSQIRLEIFEPLRAYTPLTAVTFPCESRGFSFLRCYTLERDGVTVARAASVWALIDTESRSLVRVNDFELGLPTLPPLDLAIPRLRMPSELTEIGGYGVHYGDADQNLHMNNTKYPDMYSNFLPLENRMIGSITISYKNEAKLGEKLRVHRAEYDGAYYFRTYRGDGSINSEAEIRLREIKK